MAALLVALALMAVALVALLAPAGTREAADRARPVERGTAKESTRPPALVTEHHVAAAAKKAVRPQTVGIRIIKLIDTSRRRTLITIVRYPAIGNAGAASSRDAAPQGGPYPLIVFGHGFAVTPEPYALLLDAWARAGYIVAAPVFPRGNANAPAGPEERDLPNQPADMNFVITAMQRLAAARAGPFAGRISPQLVAVAGQSDGGDTALATAFDPAAHRRPINAAVILSGAEDPFAAPFRPQAGTPLLATQGTADTINPPESTFMFFRVASAPKYLLLLDRAGHQDPYTVAGADLSAVTRVSIAFLDRYLKFNGAALRRYVSRGDVWAGTELRATP